jgi:hypothetical protein
MVHHESQLCVTANNNNGEDIQLAACGGLQGVFEMVDTASGARIASVNNGQCLYHSAQRGGTVRSWSCWNDPAMEYHIISPFNSHTVTLSRGGNLASQATVTLSCGGQSCSPEHDKSCSLTCSDNELATAQCDMNGQTNREIDDFIFAGQSCSNSTFCQVTLPVTSNFTGYCDFTD